jgi:hypothetical protein
MKQLLGMIAVLALAGCAETLPKAPYNPTQEMVTPSGHRGFAIRCSVMGECWQWAGYKCQGAYTILQGEDHTSVSAGIEGFGGAWGYSKQESHQIMVVAECKERQSLPSRVSYSEEDFKLE